MMDLRWDSIRCSNYFITTKVRATLVIKCHVEYVKYVKYTLKSKLYLSRALCVLSPVVLINDSLFFNC